MQQFSYNGETRSYSEIHRYEVTSINTDWPWNAAFSSVMKEARNIMKETQEQEAWAAHGIAKFLFFAFLIVAAIMLIINLVRGGTRGPV